MASVRIRRWSQHVTEHSNALDLQPNVFANDDPAAIARSLKKSAEQSERRKSDPFRSAMSMLSFYINRAGYEALEEKAGDTGGSERRASRPLSQGRARGATAVLKGIGIAGPRRAGIDSLRGEHSISPDTPVRIGGLGIDQVTLLDQSTQFLGELNLLCRRGDERRHSRFGAGAVSGCGFHGRQFGLCWRGAPSAVSERRVGYAPSPM